MREGSWAELDRMELVADDGESEETGGKKKQPRQSERPRVSQSFVLRCAECCFEAGWCTPIEPLLATRRLNFDACPRLLPFLLSHNESALLFTALRMLPAGAVAPRDLVALLSHFASLSLELSSLVPGTEPLPGRDSNDSAVPVDARDFLNLIVAQPVGRELLIEALKAASSKDVDLLLAYLTRMLDFHSAPDGASADPNTRRECPELPSILLWSSAVVDARLSQLVLAPSSALLVAALAERIDRQVEATRRLVALDGMVTELLSEVAHKPANERDYSIELMKWPGRGRL